MSRAPSLNYLASLGLRATVDGKMLAIEGTKAYEIVIKYRKKPTDNYVHYLGVRILLGRTKP